MQYMSSIWPTLYSIMTVSYQLVSTSLYKKETRMQANQWKFWQKWFTVLKNALSINTKLLKFSAHSFHPSPGADLGGGCKGCAPPPPGDDLRFPNTTGILPKKTMWFIGVEVEQETSAPPPKKKSWTRPCEPDFFSAKVYKLFVEIWLLDIFLFLYLPLSSTAGSMLSFTSHCWVGPHEFRPDRVRHLESFKI